MANAPSMIEETKQEMGGVSEQFEEARETVLKWIEHLEAEIDNLRAQMGGTNDEALEAAIAILEEKIKELQEAEKLLADLAQTAKEIEAEL